MDDRETLLAGGALALTVQALRESIATLVHMRQADRPPNGVELARVRHAIQRVCEAAHQQGLRAEQVIICVKHAWGSLPDGESLIGAPSQVPTLSQTVTACITEFYRALPANRPVGYQAERGRGSARAAHDTDRA